MRIPFAKQAYSSRSLPVMAQRCLNLYPEFQSKDAKDTITLHSTPGLKLFVTVGTGPIQGTHKFKDLLYVVSGTTLYSVTSTGTVTSIGICSTGGRVIMDNNGIDIVMVNGIVGYEYSIAGGLKQIVDINFFPAKTVTFQDGYFIFERTGTGQFFLSGLYAVTFLGTDFATAEGSPDDLKAVLSDTRELWLFGDNTIEVWWNSGDANFPFERYQGAYIEKGCAASYSVAKMNNIVFWLADDLSVYMAIGFKEQQISQPGIDFAIGGYARVDDAYGFTYIQEGHFFYQLTFPSENATWVFDISNKLWHERGSDYPVKRHRSNSHTKAFKKHLVGDYQNGNVYEYDLDTYTDNGQPIIRDAVSPPIYDEVDKIFMSRMQVDFESGVGLIDGQGSDPQAMLRWSDDGGKTFKNEHWKSIGKVGGYLDRVVWRRLGGFRQRIFWLRITDPVKIAIISAYAKIIGTSAEK